MSLLTFHVPKYRQHLSMLWSYLRHGAYSNKHGGVTFYVPLLPSISVVSDKLQIEWPGVATFSLNRMADSEEFFQLLEGQSVETGYGFSLRLQGQVTPEYVVNGEVVVLSWRKPPRINLPGPLPEIDIDTIELHQDYAVIKAGVFSVKVTW